MGLEMERWYGTVDKERQWGLLVVLVDNLDETRREGKSKEKKKKRKKRNTLKRSW